MFMKDITSQIPSELIPFLEDAAFFTENVTICADQLISDSLEGFSGRILWGIIQLILMVCGNIGNVLTLIVLNRRLMRKGGVNNLLQGLAISDIVAPTLACIPHIIYYYGQKYNRELIYFVNAFVMPIATGATFCSNWIVVTITCFRLLIVVKPLYSQVYCSSRNEKKALIIIFVISILSITPYYYVSSDAQKVLKVISAVFSLLCPWAICVFLWFLLLRIVNREIGIKKSDEFTLHSEVVAQRLKSKSRITKMVLIICFFNIICQLPVLILTIVGLVDSNPCGVVQASTYVGLLFLSNLLLIVNHSINFFIYSLTNCKFRYTLRVMCRHCCIISKYRHRQKSAPRQIILHDHPLKLTIHRAASPKYECNTCSNSRSRESPRMMMGRRATATTRLYIYHNQSPRVTL